MKDRHNWYDNPTDEPVLGYCFDLNKPHKLNSHGPCKNWQSVERFNLHRQTAPAGTLGNAVAYYVPDEYDQSFAEQIKEMKYLRVACEIAALPDDGMLAAIKAILRREFA